jgi:hypothetical protein
VSGKGNIVKELTHAFTFSGYGERCDAAARRVVWGLKGAARFLSTVGTGIGTGFMIDGTFTGRKRVTSEMDTILHRLGHYVHVAAVVGRAWLVVRQWYSDE